MMRKSFAGEELITLICPVHTRYSVLLHKENYLTKLIVEQARGVVAEQLADVRKTCWDPQGRQTGNEISKGMPDVL